MLSTTITTHRKHHTLFKQQRVKTKSLDMEQDSLWLLTFFKNAMILHINHDEETFFFCFRYILKGVGRKSHSHISKWQHLEKGFYGNLWKLDVYHFFSEHKSSHGLRLCSVKVFMWEVITIYSHVTYFDHPRENRAKGFQENVASLSYLGARYK